MSNDVTRGSSAIIFSGGYLLSPGPTTPKSMRSFRPMFAVESARRQQKDVLEWTMTTGREIVSYGSIVNSG